MRHLVRFALALIIVTIVSTYNHADDKDAQPAAPPAPNWGKAAAISATQATPDFWLQGEYSGEIHEQDGKAVLGAQIISLGDGKFRAVGFPGGLPGNGWGGEERIEADGAIEDGSLVFSSENGTGTFQDGQIVIRDPNGQMLGTLDRVQRASTTLGMKPPEGAVVLFDGSSPDNFDGGQLSDDGYLMQGITSKQKFGSFRLHMEFLLSYMPYARGQGRSNSGVYMQGRYEVQILDSFGLEGKNNECGGIYEIKDTDTNMCLPPLSWQTYDVEYTAAKFDAEGKKTANARISVWHNGVQIHNDVELPRSTRAAPVKEGPEPGPIYIQNHGNPLRFRNIWLVETDSGTDEAGAKVTATAAPSLKPAPAPKEYRSLVAYDGFESGDADRWSPTDPNAWRVTKLGGTQVYNQHAKSKTVTPVRSPFNRSMLTDVNVGSFVLDVDLQSTIKDYGHRDLCLFFGFQDASHFYYVHLGKKMDDHANQIFIVNDEPRTKISTKTTEGTDWNDEWHHARVKRNAETGDIAVYYDNMSEPIMTATDTTFTWGQVGIGSFDDTGNFDNVYLFGDEVEAYPDYQSLFDGKTLDGWHVNPEKIGHGTGGSWTVENGAITGEQDPPGSGNGGILLTDEKFADFELVIDMMPDWGICSGLFLRSTDKGQCYQMMVDYHDKGNVGHIYGEGVGGFNTRPYDIFGIYDDDKNLIGVTTKPVETIPELPYTTKGDAWSAAWKVSDWNRARVRVEGNPPKITTWINGFKNVEFDGATFENEKYDKAKVIELLGDKGSIAVQVHGGKNAWPEGAKCRWRNIKVKKLAAK